MFSVEFLHAIRDWEISQLVGYFGSAKLVLEVGGGTGYQAKKLADAGFDVTSIDLSAGTYSAETQHYPVIPYDGYNIPFEDGSFDIVFTSNVLEHIPHKERLYAEMDRVLKPGGCLVHVVPSSAWRIWTAITHYLDMIHWIALRIPHAIPRAAIPGEFRRIPRELRNMAALAKKLWIVPRHGETGNALTEIWTFSRVHWMRHFRRRGFNPYVVQSLPLFYTGHMVLGAKMPVPLRQRLARLLGSACIVFVIPRRMRTSAS